MRKCSSERDSASSTSSSYHQFNFSILPMELLRLSSFVFVPSRAYNTCKQKASFEHGSSISPAQPQAPSK